MPEKFRTQTNSNGDLLAYPEGDTLVSPSGIMPQSSYFFDAIERQEPINEETLDVEDNLEEFTPINKKTLHYLRLGGTRISDLTPLKNSHLKYLWLPNEKQLLLGWESIIKNLPNLKSVGSFSARNF